VTRDEVVGCLGSEGKTRAVRITFSDSVVQLVDVSCVDEEGVLHSGPNGAESQGYWTRFADITAIEKHKGSA
jgi:hypothetical protein